MARCGDCGFDDCEAAKPALAAHEDEAPPAVEIEVENGSLRLVTVMFADVQASFETVRDQDPDETRAFLNRVVRVIRASVSDADGMVAQIAGDGVKAVFGAPVGLKDHAVRVWHAALAMHEGMAHLGASGGLAPKLRIGLNSGSVLIGTHGQGNTFG